MVSRSRWKWLGGMLLLAGLMACRTPAPETARLSVIPERLTETPPAPAVSDATQPAAALALDPVKVHPETALGYENLPTTITAIYDRPPRPLAMSDVVRDVLANNRNIKIEGYTLRIAEYEIPVSKGIYDLVLSGLAQYERVNQQTGPASDTSLGRTESRRTTGQAGLSQLLPTGGTLAATSRLVRTVTLVPVIETIFPTITGLPSDPAALLPRYRVRGREETTYQATHALDLTQPLLRGFGPGVTNAQIRIAQLERRGAAADFQTQVEGTLSQTLQAYWNLSGALELYKVVVIAYSAAEDLLRVNRAGVEAGVRPQSDALQAEAAAEARRELLIRQRQAVRDAEDTLKRLILLQPGAPAWDEQLAPTQPFAWREVQVDLDEQVALAQTRRAELRRAQSDIEQAEVNLRVARNARLPQLDAIGRIESNATDATASSALRGAEEGDFTGYSAGAQFSYPLQNRAARYRYRQALARHEQTVELKADTGDQVTLEVRQAVRALAAARERIDATQAQVASQQALLTDETNRYNVGLSTAFQVLQFQADLAQAQADHLQAVVDHNVALIELERARGTLLVTYGISVDNVELEPRDKPVVFPVGLK